MMNTIKKTFCCLLIALCCSGCVGQKSNPQLTSTPACEIVVLADPQDPYFPLAEEIAATEDASLAKNLSEALACQPTYLLWVVSPGLLSDEVMIEFGMTMKGQSSAVSTGIITGSTIEQARALWQRAAQVGNQTYVAVNAPNISAHLPEGQMLEFSRGQVTKNPLTKDKFIQALQTADYLSFTGHGGNSFLGLDEHLSIKPEDIPSLNGIIVATVSCQTLRLWNDNSISRKMIDQGAAAYSGFVFSPNEGYIIGEFNELPFRYTWPDFPIGHVIQAQNRGTLQGFAHFPYHFLLGDPRIALQSEPAYQLVDDRQDGDLRTITYRGVPAGVIPMRIIDGAAYNFVEAPGITSASQGDFIYNSRMQMVNIDSDKFILLIHNGGDLTLRMRPNPPWYWMPIDIFLDSMDYTYIFLQQSGGDMMTGVFSIIPLLWIGWQIRKKRIDSRKIRPALIIGLAVAVVQGIYMAVRLPHVTITSKVVVFSPLSVLAAFLTGACGTLIFLQTRARYGKLVGIMVITFSSWAAAIFLVGVIAGFNAIAFAPRYGASLYNQSLGLLAVVSFVVSLLFSMVVLRFVGKGVIHGQRVNETLQ